MRIRSPRRDRAARMVPFLACLLLIPLTSACNAEPGAPTGATEGGRPMVVLSTSQGDIVLELDAEKAPISVKNFLEYAYSGFFDGTIFHRVIPDFMIQGGGFDPDMKQKPTRAAIKNEAENGLKNVAGSVAMARTSVVDSATAQFFINLKDNDFLNHGGRDFGYAVFGRVVEGMDVVEKIGGVRTGSKGGMQDVPVEPVVIRSVKRKDAAKK